MSGGAARLRDARMDMVALLQSGVEFDEAFEVAVMDRLGDVIPEEEGCQLWFRDGMG